MDTRSLFFCFLLLNLITYSANFVICPDNATACPEQCCITQTRSYNCCERKYLCCDYGRMCCQRTSLKFLNYIEEEVKGIQSTPSILNIN